MLVGELYDSFQRIAHMERELAALDAWLAGPEERKGALDKLRKRQRREEVVILLAIERGRSAGD